MEKEFNLSKEIKKKIKEAKYEMNSIINKGTMDKDYWEEEITKLEKEIELLEEPSEEYLMGIQHIIRYLKQKLRSKENE